LNDCCFGDALLTGCYWPRVTVGLRCRKDAVGILGKKLMAAFWRESELTLPTNNGH